MRKILSTLLIMFALISVQAQTEEDAIQFAEGISVDDLYAHLSVLASDAMQGRATGEAGQKMAAAYIASQFQKLGLKGPVSQGENKGFYQPVELYSVSISNATLKAGKTTYSHDFENIVYYGQGTTEGSVENEVIFLGKGTAEDFEQTDVTDKGVLVVVENSRAWRSPYELAKSKGAKMVYVVNTDNDEAFEKLATQWEHYLSGGSLGLEKPDDEVSGLFMVKPSIAAEMMKSEFSTLKAAVEDTSIRKKLKPRTSEFSITRSTEIVATENVLGYLEGTDKKDELIVLTAHYDHVGMDGDEIYNGADDDGSGTTAILEIAESFIAAKKAGKGPRRSILFMTVTGEEKGLLGSAYYAEHPVFPLENTVVDLNIDMIGRVDASHSDNPDYVYLVGSDRLSSELHEISEKVNATFTKLELDYTYNDEDHPDRIYYRSDHWNFAKNNVPIIFYFNGVHEDYHQPTDTIEKINFDIMKKRTELVYYTTWMLANRDGRIVVDKLQDQSVNNN